VSSEPSSESTDNEQEITAKGRISLAATLIAVKGQERNYNCDERENINSGDGVERSAEISGYPLNRLRARREGDDYD